MIVVAFDPGANCGIAAFKDGKFERATFTDGTTWRSLVDALRYLLVPVGEVTENDLCVIEQGFGITKGAKTLDRRRGLCQAAAEAHGFRRFEYVGPSTWQNKVYGPGKNRDTKKLAMDACQARYGFTPQTHDVAEAILLAQFSVDTYR